MIELYNYGSSSLHVIQVTYSAICECYLGGRVAKTEEEKPRNGSGFKHTAVEVQVLHLTFTLGGGINSRWIFDSV